MNGMPCPNCGHHLVGYRTDRQQAGEREAVLQWSICGNCRHVALESWAFVQAPPPRQAREQHRYASGAGARCHAVGAGDRVARHR